MRSRFLVVATARGTSVMRCRLMLGMTVVLLAAEALFAAAEGPRLTAGQGIYFDEKGNGLSRPEDVACDGRSRLAVADTGNGRILRYVIAGDRYEAQPEIRLPQIPYPIRVAMTSKGETYVLDGRLRRIALVSEAGEFVAYVEPRGDAAAGTTVPRAIALDAVDGLHVLDIFHARVLALDPDGRIVRQVALPRGSHGFSDVAVDGAGTIFVLDAVERRLHVARKGEAAFAPAGATMEADAAFPTALAADAKGRLFAADQHGSGIVILGPDGSARSRQSGMGWQEGRLRYPTGLCFSGNGLLFVADRENDRIEVFTVAE